MQHRYALDHYTLEDALAAYHAWHWIYHALKTMRVAPLPRNPNYPERGGLCAWLIMYQNEVEGFPANTLSLMASQKALYHKKLGAQEGSRFSASHLGKPFTVTYRLKILPHILRRARRDVVRLYERTTKEQCHVSEMPAERLRRDRSTAAPPRAAHPAARHHVHPQGGAYVG